MLAVQPGSTTTPCGPAAAWAAADGHTPVLVTQPSSSPLHLVGAQQPIWQQRHQLAGTATAARDAPDGAHQSSEPAELGQQSLSQGQRHGMSTQQHHNQQQPTATATPAPCTLPSPHEATSLLAGVKSGWAWVAASYLLAIPVAVAPGAARAALGMPFVLGTGDPTAGFEEGEWDPEWEVRGPTKGGRWMAQGLACACTPYDRRTLGATACVHLLELPQNCHTVLQQSWSALLTDDEQTAAVHLVT